LRDLKPISVELVSRGDREPLWNYLVDKYHYLGCKGLPGCNLKYLAYSRGQVVAALGWRGASLRLAARDAFIGWSEDQRKEHLGRIANGSRFLILPWVRVYTLASHVLSRNIALLVEDWNRIYRKELLVLETFVDPKKFTGGCYKAGNWIRVGRTKGYTKKGKEYRYHGQIKEVYLYVVNKRFRKIVGCRQRPVTQMSAGLRKREGELQMILRTADWNPQVLPPMELGEAQIKKLAEELRQFHEQFSGYYGRIEHHQLGLAYLQGILSSIERKTAESIALRFLGERAVRYVQNHITGYQWDHEGMLGEYQGALSNLINTGGAGLQGMWNVDSSEIRKKGSESVGVARQYCGSMGKVENCQSGVYLGYAGENGYGLVDSRLYMPKQWFGDEYEERRQKCRVPLGLVFNNKIQIALELIDKAEKNQDFSARWVGCDATFGSSYEFLDTIAKRFYYFANVKSNQQVWLERPKVGVPEWSGRGAVATHARVLDKDARPVTVAQIAGSDRVQWDVVKLAEGAKGPIISEVAAMRVIESRDGLPGKACWLFMRKFPNGQIKYALSNAPEDTPLQTLTEASTMRWSLEQCFQEAKGQLGLDHYESRSWTGWHRHMLYVFLAQLFLLKLRFRFKKKARA
jgi:SRSO17 transposase|tara:strand:+ start:292 stop:2184 length:1893 start_codon:yes stop_codon:yes gene_type:complete